ncbi:uncharacterized protein [Rutidosis leptorrhynchoides]|uniref:uncharacterized protein n=1 Tax=Rutidosis leptorrhynchoides TaxID=125765 RepID=UPI003A999A3C
MDQPDVVCWRDNDGNLHDFSVRMAWETIRSRAEKVAWFSLVWHSMGIPRRSFIVWLLVKNKLKTQDHLQVWDTNMNGGGNSAVCPFCKLVPDSQSHLFFECKFPNHVWSKTKDVMPLPVYEDNWEKVAAELAPVSHRKVARIVVTKLAFSATVYFIWQERNARLFTGKARSEEDLFQVIFSTVLLKLMSLRWKDSTYVHRIKHTWKLS